MKTHSKEQIGNPLETEAKVHREPSPVKETIKDRKDPVKRIEEPAEGNCPLCNKLFSLQDLETHAASCNGPSSDNSSG